MHCDLMIGLFDKCISVHMSLIKGTVFFVSSQELRAMTKSYVKLNAFVRAMQTPPKSILLVSKYSIAFCDMFFLLCATGLQR